MPTTFIRLLLLLLVFGFQLLQVQAQVRKQGETTASVYARLYRVSDILAAYLGLVFKAEAPVVKRRPVRRFATASCPSRSPSGLSKSTSSVQNPFSENLGVSQHKIF